MLYDIINLKKIRQAFLYAVIMLICLLLQNTFFAKIPIFGVKPLFAPCFVIAVAVFSGGIRGGVFGLLCGILTDTRLPESAVLFTIALPALGFITGLVTDRYINKRFFSYFCCCAAALAVCTLLQCASLLIFSDSSRLAAVTAAQTVTDVTINHGANKTDVLLTAAKQVIWSLPFAFAVYFPCKAIGGIK